MDSHFKPVTLAELYAGLFLADGYKDFIPKCRSLLLEPVQGREEEALSGGSGASGDPDAIEAAATEVAQLIPQALGVFKLIAERPSQNGPGSDFITVQRALHEYMLKTLYHINRNCRALLEAQIDYDKVETLEGYLAMLKKKYALLDEQLMLVGQKWHEGDEGIYYGLVERESRLKVFDTETDGVCFQIYKDNAEEQLKVPKEVCASNGLIVSKRYFFFGIFRILQHLQLSTQICELERTGATTVETVGEAEVGSYLMDAFNQAAREIL